jgi:transposase
MRGSDVHQEGMFSYVSPEKRVPHNHPLRAVRRMVDGALGELTDRFEAVYSTEGRPSIAPEKLVRALLLQIFYSIRSERLLCEQLNYNLLCRWFVGLSMDEAIWDHSTFSKNRDRLMEAEIAEEFFAQVLDQARTRGLTSDEHFSVDGTLIEAWASLKSFRPRPQPRSGFSRRAPQQRDPRLQNGRRGQARSQGHGEGSEAQLHGALAHREPQRSGGGRRAERGQWHGRKGRGRGDARRT